MQIKFLGWVLIGLLGAVVVGVLWYLLLPPKTLVQPGSQTSTTTLPSSGPPPTSISSTTPSKSAESIPVATQQGDVVMVRNFLYNGVTLPDPSNAGNYYLTGSSTNGYAIGYRTPAQYFTIALEKEPLGETRMDAENFLMSTLGINQTQMCNLKYYLGTDIHTSSFFGGKNLGFSFCPGATVLPQ